MVNTAVANTAPVRIAIAGAGISGLTLAGILSRALPPAVATISVFERSHRDHDQGYGLDLDENGQEALARAGVYNRFWEIARPHTDSMAFFPVSAHGPEVEPNVVLYRPHWLEKVLPYRFGARPECNRGKLRDILLDAIEERENISVAFDTKVSDLRSSCADVENDHVVASLFGGASEEKLGDFDLVIDTMGLHSTLRKFFVEDPTGKHYEGSVMIHGSVENPEESFPPEMLRRFEKYGSAICIGKGFQFFMQRYGCGRDDNRTSVFYIVPRSDGEDGIFRELGIPKATSRSAGIMKDQEVLGKVKNWIKEDMGPSVCPIWKQAVDCLDRVTVRNSYVHGETSIHADAAQLPIICIGDSLRNCGLGGGGILAMQDAIELSKILLTPRGGLSPSIFRQGGGINLLPLHDAAQIMLERKREFWDEKRKRNAPIMMMERDKEDPDLGLNHFIENRFGLALARLVLPPFGRYIKRTFEADYAKGIAGSDEKSHVYKNVTDYLNEAKD